MINKRTRTTQSLFPYFLFISNRGGSVLDYALQEKSPITKTITKIFYQINIFKTITKVFVYIFISLYSNKANIADKTLLCYKNVQTEYPNYRETALLKLTSGA